MVKNLGGEQLIGNHGGKEEETRKEKKICPSGPGDAANLRKPLRGKSRVEEMAMTSRVRPLNLGLCF